MLKSDQINELAAALSVAQGKLGAASFDARNGFLNNEYATIGSFIETAKPVMAECGLAVSQSVTGTGDAVGVTTVLMHASGQWIEDTVTLPLGDEKGKSRAQVAGSIVTYLRRYAYQSILGMYSADDDDDGGGGHRQAVQRPQARTATPQTVKASAPAAEPEPAYNKQAREIVLADVRTKLQAAGATLRKLHPSDIDTKEKLEYEIEIHKNELDRRNAVAKHTAQPATQAA